MENKVLEPKLRFSEFTGDWEEKKLGEVANFRRGSFPQPYGLPKWYDEEKGMPFVQVYDVGTNKMLKPDTKHRISDLAKDKSVFVEKGTVVITIQGSIGRIALTQYASFVDRTLLIFTSYNYPTDKSFFMYAVFLFFEIEKTKAPGGTIKTITKEALSNFNVALPCIEEQQKIASFLTAEDNRIALLEQKKAAIEQHKKGMLQKLFSQQIRFKDKQGNAFPDWEEKKLGEVCDVRDGTHDSPKYKEKGYPLLTSKNLLKDGSIDYDNVNLISEADFNQINKRSKVDIGDILFSMIGTIGNPFIIKDDDFTIKNIALIKEQTVIKNIFLLQLLSSTFIKKQFYKLNARGTLKFIALSVIRNLIARIPCLEEQYKIATFLTAEDNRIALLEEQIENRQQFKKGLLQQMFV